MRRVTLIMSLVAILSTSGLTGGSKKEMVPPKEAQVVPIPPMYEVTPVYIGAGFVMGRYYGYCGGEPSCRYEDVTYGLLLRAGYELNQYFGIELRGLGTFWKDDPLGGAKLRHLGIFLRPAYHFADDFNVYGLLGYGITKSEHNQGAIVKVNDNGFSAGLGLEYDLSEKKDDYEKDTLYRREFDGYADQEIGWGLFVDYQRLLIKDDIPDLDVVSIGATYDF